jgi:hypothetical protein
VLPALAHMGGYLVRRIYIVDVNWVFKMVYKMTKPFLDKKLVDEKIVVVSDRKDLLKYFDCDQLPRDFFGT